MPALRNSFLKIFCCALFLAPAVASAQNTFTYQTTVISGDLDCNTEAQNLGGRFQVATKVASVNAVCRGEKMVPSYPAPVKVYMLGLVYSASRPYSPYTVAIGGQVGQTWTQQGEQILYPTLESCQVDLSAQVALYERQVGLHVVSATCEFDETVATSQFVLKMDGFGSQFPAERKTQFFRFTPGGLAGAGEVYETAIAQRLTMAGAVIAKQGAGRFYYYRQTVAPVRYDRLVFMNTTDECATQLNDIKTIYEQAGSVRPLIWCADSRPNVIFEGDFRISEILPYADASYGSFADCLRDRSFVLSDARNRRALGAVCAPDLFHDNSYRMTLYTKN
ncbi:MAG: hypothetical protein COT73_00755 [Bdellovibrio sp. CG10_big_fil_rev_8_21_14_0_10_47_8]|nr:MAG: hypothetical protein COT73_00755 [Bdellovibrio sp. CG10_big_fil_rev_8_21_14_0_10_47_8]